MDEERLSIGFILYIKYISLKQKIHTHFINRYNTIYINALHSFMIME